jgi:uracil-DNA glycosylase family 4
VSALVRCAPPENKPSPVEIQNCLPFLIQENSMLVESKVVLCLGKIALDGFKKVTPESKKCVFKHGAELRLSDGRWLICSYHPSQQNTFTKKLTEPQFDSIFARINTLLNDFS